MSMVSPSTTLVTLTVASWSDCPTPVGTVERPSLKVNPLCRETALEIVPISRTSTRKAPVAKAHPLVVLCLEVWTRKATRLTAKPSRAIPASDAVAINIAPAYRSPAPSWSENCRTIPRTIRFSLSGRRALSLSIAPAVSSARAFTASSSRTSDSVPWSSR